MTSKFDGSMDCRASARGTVTGEPIDRGRDHDADERFDWVHVASSARRRACRRIRPTRSGTAASAPTQWTYRFEARSRQGLANCGEPIMAVERLFGEGPDKKAGDKLRGESQRPCLAGQ
jgi:hypothetical protein